MGPETPILELTLAFAPIAGGAARLYADSDFRLLCELKRIIYFDPKIAGRALQLGMTQQ